MKLKPRGCLNHHTAVQWADRVHQNRSEMELRQHATYQRKSINRNLPNRCAMHATREDLIKKELSQLMDVRKRQKMIGRVCWWCCATERWCWDGLTGSVSVHWETVIGSDRVVFPSLHKGYAIASSLHDRTNEPQPLKPVTLSQVGLRYMHDPGPILQHMRGVFMVSQSWTSLNPSVCDL